MSLSPVDMASTVVLVSFSICVLKLACSMLNDWFLTPSSCPSYILFCFNTLSARCLIIFYYTHKMHACVVVGVRIILAKQNPGTQHKRTFDGPSLIFFIWSLYFFSSKSSLPIFFSIDSPLLSTCKTEDDVTHLYALWNKLTLEIASDILGGGAFFFAPPRILCIFV